jgi:formylglycine-generating enzyme
VRGSTSRTIASTTLLAALLASNACGGATEVPEADYAASMSTPLMKARQPQAKVEAKPQAKVVEVSVAAAGTTVSATPACPAGMALVEGSYCPRVEHVCKRWLDPAGRYHQFRCAEYEANPKCKAPRRTMHFCIDADEQRLSRAEDPRPENHVSFIEAKASCEKRGARLCTEHEWTFACEGEEMRPYPYGFVRDANACNIDHFELGGGVGRLVDRRTAVGANPACTSVFGVHDLAGNLEEWVTAAPGSHTHDTVLKGSWWLPGRSTCRAANAGHDAVYEGTETGFRCCK